MQWRLQVLMREELSSLLTRIWKSVYSHFQMILMMILSAYPVLMLQFVYLHRQVIRKKMQHIDSFPILR